MAKYVRIAALVWFLICMYAILSSIASGNKSQDGGGLAMFMSMLCVPSGVLTGWLLNSFAPSFPNLPPQYALVSVWLPFFLVGCLQWWGLIKLAKWADRHDFF